MLEIRNPITFNDLLARWGNNVAAKLTMNMIAANELAPYIAISFKKRNNINYAYCNKAIVANNGGISCNTGTIVFEFANVEAIEKANGIAPKLDEPQLHAIERRYGKRGEISQKLAAELCGVSENTIHNWDKDKTRSNRYPGRADREKFLMFSIEYKLMRADRRDKRAIKNAVRYSTTDTMKAEDNCPDDADD